MSDFLLTLVLQIKTSKIINGMAKVQIKSERITPFGGIFQVRELFSRFVGPVIDKVLGLRCTSFGYQYGEIAGSLASVYFCGGDCVEDVTSHLMPHLSLHPTLRTCSSDTILRAISELATANTTYTSDTGKSYDFNTATRLNRLLVKALLSFRTEEDKPHQSLRVQVHQRASQVDKNGKTLSVEYLHGQQIISEPFCIHRRLRNRIRGLTVA